jgi:energy-coupling factor transport system permease protein
MLVTVLLHFSAFSRVMTTDKFMYLFGKLIPALSLVLSMSLRFVPRFKKQAEAIVEAQRCIGRDISAGSPWQRFRAAATVLSALITWALENAIETADSMKSRGYGLRGRTAFSLYRMADRDKYALAWLVFCGLFLSAGILLDVFEFHYFPGIRYTAFEMSMLPFYAVYFALCLTPTILNVAKERQWKIIRSSM